MKYLGTSSKNLIVRGCQFDLNCLQDGKDLQDILVRENIIYPLHSQPKVHNIQRGAKRLGISIIVTNYGAYHLSTWTHRAEHHMKAPEILRKRVIVCFRDFCSGRVKYFCLLYSVEIPRQTYTAMVVTGELSG